MGLWLPGSCAVACFICWLLYLADPVTFFVIRPPDVPMWFVTALATTAFLLLMWYPLGLMVWHGGWSVAHTRKVTHTIFIMVLPASAVLSSHGEGLARDIFISLTWMSLGTTMVFGIIFLQPLRKRVHVFRIAFASTERSDDRPNALLWMLMQSTAMTMVQTPMIQWMLSENKGMLIWIPFMSVALGDGLAEPVGRMWGRHKYDVYAICTTKSYTRSYEGSACVFFFTALAIVFALPEMTWAQFGVCMLVVPLANTVTEAKSPHTFDNHLMFGMTWVLLWIIFDILPLSG